MTHGPKVAMQRWTCNDDWTNLSKVDESRAGNSLTAARTESPSFTASSWLAAYGVLILSVVKYLEIMT